MPYQLGTVLALLDVFIELPRPGLRDKASPDPVIVLFQRDPFAVPEAEISRNGNAPRARRPYGEGCAVLPGMSPENGPRVVEPSRGEFLKFVFGPFHG